MKLQGSWNPINDDTIRASALTSISAISHDILTLPTHDSDPIELCERALLFAYLAVTFPDENWLDETFEYLNRAIERLAALPVKRLGLYGGLAGIGWIIQHISFMLPQLIDDGTRISDDADILREVDLHLDEQYSHPATAEQDYDLISGIVGIGLYWLVRLPHTRDAHGITQTLNLLNSLSQRTSEGTTWFTPSPQVPASQRSCAPHGYYNLGVAHGVPGVIGFLAQVASLSAYPKIGSEATTLLDGSVKWLFAQRRPRGSVSRYSNWIVPGEQSGDSRLAWCYGDLGIASVLHMAGMRVRRQAWSGEAIAMARECAKRRTQLGVFDATLCHGALGVAHMFHRFYNATRDELFREATTEWTQRGLACRQNGTGLGGYHAWDTTASGSQRVDASFLSGSIGIALSLLSLVSTQEPAWDRLMLLSNFPSHFGVPNCRSV